ncbi:MAG: ATP-binding protein [Alphaproteobacteria bacterium]
MLPTEIKTIVDVLKKDPGNDGMFMALLALLGNAPDSTVVVEALTIIEPHDNFSDESREKAFKLLENAEDKTLAAKWGLISVNVDAGQGDNVVSLRSGDTDADSDLRLQTQDRLGPQITFDDIGGLENVKSQIRRKIIKPFNNPGLFKKFKRRAGGGVLMYGPPGCGKTMIARALANECNAQFIEVRAADIWEQWQGVSEKRIAEYFAKARANAPAVLFFDEVEALAMRRRGDEMRGVTTVVSTFLNEMNGFGDENEGLLFLGATNVPWSIDSAFRRPGRFDRTIFVAPPDRVARGFILKLLLQERPVADDLDTKFIVEKTSGFSGADLEALVEAAVDYAIDDSDHEDNIASLTNEHFKEAFQEVHSSTGEWLGLAKNYSEYAARDGMYDDLKEFLKKHT